MAKTSPPRQRRVARQAAGSSEPPTVKIPGGQSKAKAVRAKSPLPTRRSSRPKPAGRGRRSLGSRVRRSKRSRRPSAPPSPAPAAGRAGANAPQAPTIVRRGRPSARTRPDVETLAHNIARAIEAGRQGAGRLSRSAAERRDQDHGRRRNRRDGAVHRPGGRILHGRSRARRSGAGGAGRAVRRPLGFDPQAPAGRGPAGRRARRRRQALRRPGVARQSLFRFHQAGLRSDGALGGRSGQARRRPRSARPRQGAILPSPGHRGAVALELPRHQSGDPAHDDRRERRESGAGPENAGRGHRGRPRQLAHSPVRRARVQARRQSGGDARQGDLPQRR